MSLPTPPSRPCQALMIAAPASGQGKTTVVAGLARHLRQQGLKVRVFKMGPDYIDPMIHEQASDAPVYQLDLWMMGEAHCRALLAEAAAAAHWILIESVMGLYDGNPSSAEFSRRLGIPVALLIDGSAMAQTFGALAFGLARYESIRCAGIIANRVNSAGHASFLQESLKDGLHLMGHLPTNPALTLPERHLGLVTAAEISDLDARLDACARWIADARLALPDAPFDPLADSPAFPVGDRLQGIRIAIARDAAFCFLYRANLRWLESMGARLTFFSPLTDRHLPEADALYLPGGYPELHLDALARNSGLQQQIRDHVHADKPLLAECGGLLYLLESLQDAQGNRAPMTGLIPGRGLMNTRLSGIGMQAWPQSEGQTQAELRGHSFHYGQWLDGPATGLHTHPARKSSQPEALYQSRRLTASFTHWYFPSAPALAAQLFRAG